MKNVSELKTFEDACKVEGLDATTVIPDFSASPEKDRKPLEATAKLLIITRAANKLANDGKEWLPDWNNYEEIKYHAWFDMEGGSSGFRFVVFVAWSSLSLVGSRLCFVSSEAAQHVAETFLDLYKQLMVIE